MKQLTPQIAAFYLGAECVYKDSMDNEVKSAIMSVTVSGYAWMMEPDEEVAIDLKELKLILRPLSSMTEEEAREFAKNEGWGVNLENIVVTDRALEFSSPSAGLCVSWFSRLRPQAFTYLLSKSFDLFGLIEANLAIDKTKTV